MKQILQSLQKLGKALMLPIATLPIAGLLLRFGQADMLNIPFLANAGDALFSNLPLLFAIGIAVGLAKDNNGAAGLAGAVSFYVLNSSAQAINFAIQSGTIFQTETEGLAEINMAHFGGIIAGILAGVCYNKFKDTKLPDWLGFFGGRRFVPIMSGLTSLLTGGILGTFWLSVQNLLDNGATWMVESGGIGAFLYGMLNRLLLPVGLHHVANTFIWFNFGDIDNFFLTNGAEGGVFTAGFFPIMMFALPAAALAMYVCAKKENKVVVGGALFSVAFTAFLTGITEPIEFMFMFLAPVLYVIHGIMMGISLAVCQLLGIRDSFNFSAGAIDYLLNFRIAENGWMIIPLGLVFGVVYFFLFMFVIKKFDLKTPGREDEDDGATESVSVKDKDLSELAKSYVELLGGKDNIQEVEACITRLRMTLKNNKDIDEKSLKALGASGVMKAGSQVTQVIVGTKAELIVEEMKKYL